MPHHFIKSE